VRGRLTPRRVARGVARRLPRAPWRPHQAPPQLLPRRPVDRVLVTEYDPDGLRAELREAGLEVVELEQVWGELWAEARPREA